MRAAPKSKTAATWLALVGGTLGLHRFYLYGFRDRLGWLFFVPTLLGWQGVQRMQTLGVDDRLAWLLTPWLGVTLSIAMLSAIVYGLTPDAQRFVGELSFSALTGAPVLSTEWERDPARGVFPGQAPPEHDPLSHLELVRNADALLIAPATANTIAKLATGLADNLLTSAALAATCPVVVAPAMNNHMWEHAATQSNIALLRERGVVVVDPEVGALASKHEWGAGRLADPESLLAAVEAVMPTGERPWDGLRVLVTAGGTREPIDAVRFAHRHPT